MRLLPRSLFSRLLLVLLAGLVVAQVASLSIHMHERGELIAQASGMQAAQRIADIVRLFDTLDAAERRRIMRVFSAPPVTISLDEAPFGPAQAGAEDAARAALFGALLRRYLGDARGVAVRRIAAIPWEPGKGMMMGFRAQGMPDGWTPPWAGMHAGGAPGFAFATQVRLKDGTLVTFNSRQPARTESWPYRVLASLAVLLAAVIALSWLAVRWVTRPLGALADAADALGRDINRPPMPETGPAEVTRTARAFNTMQARLAGYLRDRTRVLAAMSHDLKTPVTRLRLRAELLEDEQLKAKFARDLDEMEAMVSDTLDFLRGFESEEVPGLVDVGALLESVRADAELLGGRVTVEGGAARPIAARPQALKRCVANLVENAVKYGKTATIVVRDSEERLEISVRDEGPGLPEGELEKVFDPFYRVEVSRSRVTGGTGLGLTIARSIVEANGGSLVLRNRPEGGLEARLTLPRARPDGEKRADGARRAG
ncbi:MAG: HAMP domain-containing protein [Burkholderiales bacterium]|nr:HAMP domain-containing protein [Burkholderiales bacterium]